MTRALIRKDLRLLRPVLVGAVAFITLFDVVFPLIAVATNWDVVRVAASGGPLSLRWRLLGKMYAGVFTHNQLAVVPMGLPAVLALVAVTGGMAFAVERRERSAELLAMLPVSRRRVVAVKLLTAGGTCLLLAMLVFAASAMRTLDEIISGRFVLDNAVDVVRYVAWLSQPWTPYVLMPAVFGVAWLASSLTRSAIAAATLAVGVGGLHIWALQCLEYTDTHSTVNLLQVLAGSYSWSDTEPVLRGVSTWALRAVLDGLTVTLGVGAVVAGTVVQVRRGTP